MPFTTRENELLIRAYVKAYQGKDGNVQFQALLDLIKQTLIKGLPHLQATVAGWIQAARDEAADQKTELPTKMAEADTQLAADVSDSDTLLAKPELGGSA